MLKKREVELLKLLNEDSWQKNTVLAAKMGISRSTLQNGIKKLIERGVMLKYSILVAPFIYFKKVFYEIKTNPKQPEILEKLKSLQYESLEGIIGDYSLIIKQNFWSDFDFINNLNQMDQLKVENFRLVEIYKTYKEHGLTFPENP
ncbi:MAG: hypothetical protein ACXQS8_00275, partial [Candidatus Helarchaeales archaeon]